MTSRQISRTATAKHMAIGAIVGTVMVIAIATVIQAQLRREERRTAEALAEAQLQAALVESNNRRITELQAKVNNAEQKLAERNQKATARKSEAQRLRADWQMTKRNESELKRLRDELEDLERKNRQYFPWPPVPDAGVKGKVKAFEENLAVVDIGRQDGLKPGILLQVYRTTSQPQYLGALTIQRAESHRSVGLFKPANKDASIQVGDIVDTKVLR